MATSWQFCNDIILTVSPINMDTPNNFWKINFLLYQRYWDVIMLHIDFWQVMLMDFKNRMQLCLKVNKKQQKCHMNCVGGMLEGRVCGHLKKWFLEQNEHWAASKYTRYHWAWIWREPNCSWLGNREKSNCTRLANVKSEHDPRMKMIKCFKLSLYQSCGGIMNKKWRLALYQPWGSRAKK